MKRIVYLVTATLLIAAVLFGCSSQPSSTGTTIQANVPGTYPKRGGRVEIIGTLERSEVEGGFWSIVEATPNAAAGAKTIAVIANGDKFADRLKSLTGQYVRAKGTALEGASTRMAGPEISLDSIEAASAP